MSPTSLLAFETIYSSLLSSAENVQMIFEESGILEPWQMLTHNKGEGFCHDLTSLVD